MASENKPAKAADSGEAESQKIADEGTAQGFLGTKVDPLPNSAHSLESGPESPTIAEQQAALKAAQGSGEGR